MILLNKKKQKLLFLMLIAILLLITLIVIMLQPKIFETIEILNADHIEIQSMFYNGVPTDTEQELLLKYISTLQLVKVGDKIFQNTAADVYITIYSDTQIPIYEFWIYGNGNLIETMSNSRYRITNKKTSELIEIIEKFTSS